MEKERGSKREGRGRQEAAAQMPEGEEVLRKRSGLLHQGFGKGQQERIQEPAGWGLTGSRG